MHVRHSPLGRETEGDFYLVKFWPIAARYPQGAVIEDV